MCYGGMVTSMLQCREFLAIKTRRSVVSLIDASEVLSALADDFAENCLRECVAADRWRVDVFAAREAGVTGLCSPGGQPSFDDAGPSGSFRKTIAPGTVRVHSPFSTFTEDWEAARDSRLPRHQACCADEYGIVSIAVTMRMLRSSDKRLQMEEKGQFC